MSVNASGRVFAVPAAVVVCAALGCGGNVVEIVNSDASTGSTGMGSGSSGSGSGGKSGSGPTTCSGATCAGCCTQTGFCAGGSGDNACGVGGPPCQDCTTAGSTCQGGTCVHPSSSSSGSSSGGTCTCPGGCCDATNSCYAGVIDMLCGGSGGQCVDCTASGQVCQGGTCVSPSPPPTCVGSDASSCQIACVIGEPCCKGDGVTCGCMLVSTCE
jgi:hypothetical protein